MAKSKGIDISTLNIQKIIVHSIPKHKKNEKTTEPKYSEKISTINDALKLFFKDKIVAAFRSPKAFRISFDRNQSSPISNYISSILVGNRNDFLTNSKQIGKHLFEVQAGTNNEGILLVIDCKVNDFTACAIIKLEMDTGAQLILDEKTQSYNIEEVEDLMLTKKTKIFKLVLFFNKPSHKVKYDGIIMDYQIDTNAKKEITTWFISKFLGCKAFEDPSVQTHTFFNLTRTFINTIDDDVKRAKYYQDLNSYIQMNSNIISPEEFANNYMTTSTHKNEYKKYLESKGFSFESFPKDTTHIERQIEKITVEFMNDITIIGAKGTFADKVKFDKMENGQIKAEIISRVKTIK